MSGGLNELWVLLARSWLAVPRSRLVERVGCDAVSWLERSGAAQVVPLEAGDRYPCRVGARPGCAMRVVGGGSLVAVCELGPTQCLDEPITEEDAVRLVIDPTGLVPVLQQALRLHRAPWQERGNAIVLGDRRLGNVLARFVLLRSPRRFVEEGRLDVLATGEDPDRVLVVLTCTRAEVPVPAPADVRGIRVRWVALNESLVPADHPVVDLAGVWQSVGVGADELAAELWPRFTFVVDAGRVWYAGQRLPLDRHALAAAFLLELLRHPGEWVSRLDLFTAVWPHAVSARTRRPRNPVALSGRLRDECATLRRAFASLALPPGVPVDPITNLAARVDDEGGYRVEVDRSRVRWLADLPT